MKKLVFVSIDGLTDPLGQSQIIPYLAGLSAHGLEVFIASLEKDKKFAQKEAEIRGVLKVHSINWIPIPYRTKIPIISQLINFWALNSVVKKLYRENTGAVIHCRNYMSGIIGLNLKRKYGARFIFDMRGFWANERIDGKIWRMSNPIHHIIYRYFKRKEIELLLHADYIVSLTRAAREEFCSWPELKNVNLPVKIIPCCVDLEHFCKENTDEKIVLSLREELRIGSNDFVISYLGSLGTWYMSDEMLLFFKCLQEKKSNAKFLIISADDPEIIYGRLSSLGIDKRNIIVRSASRNEVPCLLEICHISLYFIKPAYSKIASSPTKLGEILAMGKPVITNSGIGDCDSIIADEKAGLLVKEFDQRSYAGVINEIDKILQMPSSHFRSIAEKHFSLNKGIEAYYGIYNELLNKSGH